jgi:simple sugar transport system ATP-binding protein
MVGRPVQLVVDKKHAEPGDTVLAVDSLTIVDAQGVVLVDGVSLSVKAGEIYAIAGVQGNGQTELTEALVGLQTPTQGSIVIDGQRTASMTTKQILEIGVGYVPEDRLHDGLIGSFTVAENMILDVHSEVPFARAGSLKLREIRSNAAARVQEFDVRPPTPSATASTLSGGNQQKVVLARELSRPLRLLIVAQPTRGLDVGSMEFVHRRIVAARDAGAAVVLVSTELDEVLGLADRIAVMYRGKIAGEVPAGTAPEVLGLLMAGADPEHAEAEAEPLSPGAAGNPEAGGAL